MSCHRLTGLLTAALVAVVLPGHAQQAAAGNVVASSPDAPLTLGDWQRRAAVLEVSLETQTQLAATQNVELTNLRSQLAEAERSLAILRERNGQAEARLRALGTAPVEGGDAVQRRLIDAISAAVELSQRGETLRGASSAALEQLLVALGRDELSPADRDAVAEASAQLRQGLATSESEQRSERQELSVTDYDADLRLAILSQGSSQGLTTGLRLRTDRAAREGATAETSEQQLLVVEVRPRLAGAIQLSDNAPALQTGEILKPVLETDAH